MGAGGGGGKPYRKHMGGVTKGACCGGWRGWVTILGMEKGSNRGVFCGGSLTAHGGGGAAFGDVGVQGQVCQRHGALGGALISIPQRRSLPRTEPTQRLKGGGEHPNNGTPIVWSQ